MRGGAAPSAGHVCQRVVAAVIGGYALAVTASTCLSFILPLPRDDATLTGLLISFAIYAGAVLWAFAVHSLQRLWWGIGGTTAACASLCVLLASARVP